MLLAYGGNYVNLKYINVDNFLVTVFPFGVGSSEMKRRNKVSRKESLKKYLRTSLPHFQRGNTVRLLNHIFSRRLSYETGIMIGCSNYGGTPLAEPLVGLTTQDIKSAPKENYTPLTEKNETVDQSAFNVLLCSWPLSRSCHNGTQEQFCHAQTLWAQQFVLDCVSM